MKVGGELCKRESNQKRVAGKQEGDIKGKSETETGGKQKDWDGVKEKEKEDGTSMKGLEERVKVGWGGLEGGSWER